jgi:hypothetical protein
MQSEEKKKEDKMDKMKKKKIDCLPVRMSLLQASSHRTRRHPSQE